MKGFQILAGIAVEMSTALASDQSQRRILREDGAICEMGRRHRMAQSSSVEHPQPLDLSLESAAIGDFLRVMLIADRARAQLQRCFLLIGSKRLHPSVGHRLNNNGMWMYNSLFVIAG